MNSVEYRSDFVVGGFADRGAVHRSMLNQEIQKVIGYRSTINVDLQDGVVTLSGYFANNCDLNNALRKAVSNPGVVRVINNAR